MLSVVDISLIANETDWPKWLLPQHSSAFSEEIAQVFEGPRLIEWGFLRSRVGTVVWPKSLWPMHQRVFLPIEHKWFPPSCK